MKKFLFEVLVVFIMLLGVVGCSTPAVSEPSFYRVPPTVFEHDGYQYVVDDYSQTEEVFIMELAANGLGSYQMYDASELTTEILENRNGITIIERCVGMVVDKTQGDGIILNACSPEYNYISYRSCGQEVCDGTILVSYMVYNPDTNYIDDITERHDFVICREYED